MALSKRSSGLRSSVTAFAALALVLGSAAWMMTAAEEGKTKRAFLVEHALPEGSLVHLRFDGQVVERNWDRLAIAQLMADEQMAAFMAPMMQAAEGMLAEPMREIEDETGLKFDEMSGMLKGTLTATVVDFDMGDGNGPPDADVVLTFDLVNDKELVKKLGSLIAEAAKEGLGEVPREVDLAGQSAWKVQVEGFDLYWAASEGHLVAGTKAKTLGEVLTRLKAKAPVGGLFANDDFRSGFAKTVPTGEAATFAHVDIERLLALARTTPISEEIPFDTIVEGMGLNSFKSMSYGMSMEGRAIVDRFHTSMPQGGKGFYANMNHSSKPLATAGMAPKDALAFYALRYNLAAMVDSGLDLLEELDEDAAAEVDQMLGEFEKNTGFSLVDDFLASLGEEVGFWMGSSPYGGMIPEFVIALEVAKPDRIDFCWKRMSEKMAEQVPTRTMSFKGKELRWFDMGPVMGNPADFGPGMKPTMMMDGKFLLISFAPQTLKNYVVSKAAQRQPLTATKDLDAGLAHLRRDNPETGFDAMAYVDLGRVMTTMIDTAVPLAQNVNMPPEVPVDMALFPTSDVFRRHLFGMTMTGTYSPTGIDQAIHSPMGYVSMFMAMGAAAGVAVFAEQEMRSAEAEEFGWEELEPVEPTQPAPVEPPKKAEGGGKR